MSIDVREVATVQDLITAAREHQGLTRAAVADKRGVSRTAHQDLEARHDRSPRWTSIINAIAACDATVVATAFMPDGTIYQTCAEGSHTEYRGLAVDIEHARRIGAPTECARGIARRLTQMLFPAGDADGWVTLRLLEAVERLTTRGVPGEAGNVEDMLMRIETGDPQMQMMTDSIVEWVGAETYDQWTADTRSVAGFILMVAKTLTAWESPSGLPQMADATTAIKSAISDRLKTAFHHAASDFRKPLTGDAPWWNEGTPERYEG